MKTLLGVFLFFRAIGEQGYRAELPANAKIRQEAADHSQTMLTLPLLNSANQ
jgi:hypothetical protein